MSKPTPGPWFLTSESETVHGYSEEGEALIVVYELGTNEADHRLIAAAPELLDALRGYVAFAAMRRHELGELSPEMEVVDAVARAAIAKAEVQS